MNEKSHDSWSTPHQSNHCDHGAMVKDMLGQTLVPRLFFGFVQKVARVQSGGMVDAGVQVGVCRQTSWSSLMTVGIGRFRWYIRCTTLLTEDEEGYEGEL